MSRTKLYFRNVYNVDIPKVVIFDGNSLAHRVRHTINLSYNGQDVSVFFGFIRSMHTYWRKARLPKSTVVCWDCGIPQERYAMVPSYKERKHEDDPMWPRVKEQMQILHEEVLPKMGVLSIRLQDTEADDLIARCCDFMCRTFKHVVSGDKDLWQLIDMLTNCHDGVKDNTVTIRNFKKNTDGVPMDKYLYYRALVGDSSDHIPGVPGIGDKTAKQLIEQFNTPEELYKAVTFMSKSAVKTKLEKFGYKEFMATMNCMDLHSDVSKMCQQHVAEALQTGWQPGDWNWVYKWLDDNGFDSIVYDTNPHPMVDFVHMQENPAKYLNFVETL